MARSILRRSRCHIGEYKAKSSKEMINLSKSIYMMRDELNLIKKRIGVILLEAADFRLSNHFL